MGFSLHVLKLLHTLAQYRRRQKYFTTCMNIVYFGCFLILEVGKRVGDYTPIRLRNIREFNLTHLNAATYCTN